MEEKIDSCKIMKSNTRDASIDILRFMALTGIILVHTEPTLFWTQLRSFDVPLMVLLSALCFGMGDNKNIVSYPIYLRKRFIRLVLPSWIFLTIYFIVSFYVTLHISINKVIMCYTLTTSWYFWIIRILVGMAIIAPFLKKMSDSLTKRSLLFVCVIMFVFTEFLSIQSSDYFYKMFVMFIPYVAYYLIGMNINKYKEKTILKYGIIFIIAYAFLALFLYIKTGEYIPTGRFKYPPRLYYTLYALGISAILWYYRNNIVWVLIKVKLFQFAKFVGSHTFWIYLWHIPIVDYMVEKYDSSISFVVVYFSAIIITFIQTVIIEKVCECVNSIYLRKNLKMIFIG